MCVLRQRLALFLVMLPRKRPRAGYQHCPHCDKLMSTKLLKEHRRLYWDAGAKVWHCDADSERGLCSDATIEDLFSCHDNSGTNEGEVERRDDLGGSDLDCLESRAYPFSYHDDLEDQKRELY